MTDYDSPNRPLHWPYKNAIVFSRTVEDDGDCEPSSFIWPSDPDERVVIPFSLSLNEYNVLASAIDVGSDIAYGADGPRVMWLWLRNMRCEVTMPSTACCGPSISDRINAESYNNSQAAIYTANMAQFVTDGNSTAELAPNMTTAETPQYEIDKIMCFGLLMFLSSVRDQARGVHALSEEAAQDLIEQLGIAMAGLASAGGLAIGLGGAAGAVVAFVGGPWALLGLALAGIGTGLASEFVTIENEVLTDEDAFNEVLCTMRMNSIGNEPNIEIWQNLLNPNTFAPDSNAEKLAALVQPFLNDVQFFIQFVISMSDLEATNIIDSLPECEICPPDIACDGGEGNNFLASDAMWTPYIDRAEYVAGGTNRGWGPNVPVSPSRISIWRAIAPEPERMKFNTKGDVSEIRVYSSTSGVIGSLLAAVSTWIVEADGTFTWEIPTMTGAPEILIDCGGTTAMDDDNRLRSICWNYDE